MDEGGNRGNAPFQEIMAVEVLMTLYKDTFDERYLEGMLQLFRCYLASQLPNGGAMLRYNAKGYRDDLKEGANLGNNVAQFLRISAEVAKILEDNEDMIRRLGYGDVVDVFSSDARSIDLVSSLYGDSVSVTQRARFMYRAPEFTLNAFETPRGRVVYRYS